MSLLPDLSEELYVVRIESQDNVIFLRLTSHLSLRDVIDNNLAIGTKIEISKM